MLLTSALRYHNCLNKDKRVGDLQTNQLFMLTLAYVANSV